MVFVPHIMRAIGALSALALVVRMVVQKRVMLRDIPERRNLKLQMQHMPKRHWKHMVEMVAGR